MSWEFLITSIVVILLPGTGVLYTIAIGLGKGYKASFAAAFGCTMGIVPAALASIIGLAALFHTSALAFQIIKYLGVAYLLYMAWKMLRDDSLLTVSNEAGKLNLVKVATHGALINILNPKLSFFFLAFLPQFIPSNAANPTILFVSQALVFMLLTFIVFTLYGAGASLVQKHILTKPKIQKWLQRSFAAAFGVLSIKLALTEK